jgi:hypothetical protein
MRPLKPVDHPPLKSLSDARVYMLELPDGVARIEVWQYAAELLLKAADDGDQASIRHATDQLERALFLTYRLDLKSTS